MPRVHPELVNQVDRIRGRDDFDGEPQDEERQVEYPPEQEAGAGLPECRGQVVLFALMVHGVRSPKDRNFVAATVCPVIAEVPAEDRKQPPGKPGRRQVEPGRVDLEYRELACGHARQVDRQKPREVAERRADRTRAQAADRIVAAVIAGAAPAIYGQLDQQRQQEERNGK